MFSQSGTTEFESRCDRQSVGQSVLVSSPFGAHDQMLSTVRQSGYCGAPSDGRAGLSFLIALVRLLSIFNKSVYIQLLYVKKTYIYTQYIQGFCQSRLRTADHALYCVASGYNGSLVT
jgi:hypothetical protein